MEDKGGREVGRSKNERPLMVMVEVEE